MPKFRFTEIAINSTEKKKPVEEDKFTYIGLEHLDSGTLTVSRWGSDIAPIGEKLVMKKGDVLFGKRRAYQKKVGIAPFDGIFSAHGMVLRPREEVITKEYFPLFISSDYFLNEAIRISVGSLSPTVNWKDLKDLEFTIPSIEEQKRITPLIWAAIEAKNAYKEQMKCTDDLVKSQFIEMFGSPVSIDKKWPVMTVGEVSTSQLGKMLNAKNQTGKDQHYYLANRNVQWFSIDLTDLRMMDFYEPERAKYQLTNGDLLVCEGGEIGRCAIWHGEIEDCYIQNAVHRVHCNTEYITPLFLGNVLYYHAMENGFSDIVGSKATIAHLPADKLKAMKIPVPPIALQHQFEAVVQQSDKSKFELQQAIDRIDNLIKTLIQQ